MGIGLPASRIERIPVEVLQLEGRQSLKARDRERLDDRQALEQPAELVLVSQPIDVPRTGVFGVEHLEDNRASVGHPHRSIHGRSVPFVQPLCQRVCLRRCGSPSPWSWASVCPLPILILGPQTPEIQTDLAAGIAGEPSPQHPRPA